MKHQFVCDGYDLKMENTTVRRHHQEPVTSPEAHRGLHPGNELECICRCGAMFSNFVHDESAPPYIEWKDGTVALVTFHGGKGEYTALDRTVKMKAETIVSDRVDVWKPAIPLKDGDTVEMNGNLFTVRKAGVFDLAPAAQELDDARRETFVAKQRAARAERGLAKKNRTIARLQRQVEDSNRRIRAHTTYIKELLCSSTK